MMKEKCKKGVEIIVESVNFIIITYALSSVSEWKVTVYSTS